MNSFFTLNLISLVTLFFVETTLSNYIPTLSPPLGDNVSSLLEDGFETYFYTQTLDHFNYARSSYATFSQKYVVNSRYWGGPNSSRPLFAYLGAEHPMAAAFVNSIGIINDNAPHFKALSVFIEHRFYGESVPFGTMKEALQNETTRGYFNSAQALADYAEILLSVKETFWAHDSPVIVVGGSYGGMLASWFRLKYPHLALGALASSAPVLYFDDMDTSESCYEVIRRSWDEIDSVASMLEGLAALSLRFKTCSQLNSADELKQFLIHNYATATQYNYPRENVRRICQAIDGAPTGIDVIGRIFAGIVAYLGDIVCYRTNSNSPSEFDTEIVMGWNWQRCSEMVMPIGIGENDTMFQASPFNLEKFSQWCEYDYGVPPRPHWITMYYGGHQIKTVLKNFGSNIIFSNGLQDPYSSAGVLEDINESIVAITSLKGSHCVDLAPASKHDPEWLIEQRNTELQTIEGWLATYYRGGGSLYAPHPSGLIIIIILVTLYLVFN